MSPTSLATCNKLAQYTACDIADALLRLKVPAAGFLKDITPITSSGSRIALPCRTVLLAPVTSTTTTTTTTTTPRPRSLPAPYPDLVGQPDTIALVSAPAGLACAAMGGLLAARLHRLGTAAAVVAGRVRDLSELRALGRARGPTGEARPQPQPQTELEHGRFAVWAAGVSAVGSAGQAAAVGLDVPVSVGQAVVESGDVILLDYENGCAVAVPAGRVDDVLALLPRLTEADDKVRADVLNGRSLKDAFAEHRGKL